MRFLLFGVIWATIAFAPFSQAQLGGVASDALNDPARESGTAAPANRGSSTGLNPRPIRVDVDLVLVPVTVSDSMNQPIVDLEKRQFTIYENGREQEIRYFSKEDAPMSVGLLLDVSNSMASKIDMERQAVGDFFRSSNPQDDFFVITFSNRPKLVADTTASIGTIQGKLSTTNPAGYTALLDSVYFGLNKLRSAKYERRALVIISDGGENNSRYKAREIKSIAEESNVQIYAIRTYDALPFFRTIEEKMGNKLLTEITEATGGRTISVDNASRIPEAVATVSRDLRNQYVLGYRSTSVTRNGEWRKIKVKVLTSAVNHSPLRVDYKKGYVAPQH
jgi:Ca-activated chloride channel family protein